MSRTEKPYVPGLVTLTEKVRINPEFIQITLAGAPLRNLAEHGLDQRVKLLIPRAQPPLSAALCSDADTWYESWRRFPDEVRENIRTYTILNPDSRKERLEILVADHKPIGVAGDWLEGASIGDQLVIVFPNSACPSSIGIDWNPGKAHNILVIADTSALPAVAGILEKLPKGSATKVIVETTHPIDDIVQSREGVEIQWLQSAPRKRVGSQLVDWASRNFGAGKAALEDASDQELVWDLPENNDHEKYLWCAAEAGVVKTLRTIFQDSGAFGKEDSTILGYWKNGISG